MTLIVRRNKIEHIHNKHEDLIMGKNIYSSSKFKLNIIFIIMLFLFNNLNAKDNEQLWKGTVENGSITLEISFITNQKSSTIKDFKAVYNGSSSQLSWIPPVDIEFNEYGFFYEDRDNNFVQCWSLDEKKAVGQIDTGIYISKSKNNKVFGSLWLWTAKPEIKK